jgi:hypothetical protein
MRIFLALTVLFFSLINSADAAVEAQICGIWQSDDGTILRIQTDGQFSKSANGRTETGTITAIDGKWSLQSNNGKPDGGTFSVLQNSLTLRSSFTSTTTWKRSSGASSASMSAPTSTPVPARTISTPLQSSISQSIRQSIARTSNTDPFTQNQNQNQNFANRSQETISNPPRRRGFRDSVRALVENAASSNPSVVPNFGNQSRFTGTSGGGGQGTYSQMRKAFEQEELNSLPPPRPISNNPQADETELYGVSGFERKALGPATPIRIKMF